MLRMMQLITKNALIRPPGALNQWTQPILAQQGARIYVRSLNLKDGILYFIGAEESEKSLYLASEKSFASPFRGDESHDGGLYLLKAELSAENASLLHHFFPFTQPRSLRNERTTIGCGDRLGLATPGHLRAIEGYDAFPVLAQQSIRELTLTGRGYDRVVADATFLVFQEGYTRGYGADGDHLKTIKDIDVALAAKMPMITLDLTDFLAPRAAEMSAAKVDEVFEQVDPHLKAYIHENYEGKTFNVRGAAFVLDRTEARRCALMYWRALDFSRDVDRHLKEKIGSDYDLEISIDETTTPTLPSHHLFIARELLARHVIVNSLAPRFIGEFQKAIDYRGDIREFDKQLAEHCLIAKEHGNYKISIHSGSDKYSVFPAIGKRTEMHLHLKTSGTSWLEATRVVSQIDPDLFRKMLVKAKMHFAEAQRLYHVTTNLDAIPESDSIADSALQEYLSSDDSRQLLHITYGWLLQDLEIRGPLLNLLRDNEEAHYAAVANNMAKHIRLLGIKPIMA